MFYDKLNNYVVYRKAFELYYRVLDDTDILMKDLRSREIARQIVRSAGSISANIEEGYGRGYSDEFIRYLRVSRGSARETRGWYLRSKKFLDNDLIDSRVKELNEILLIQTSMISKLERNKGKKRSQNKNFTIYKRDNEKPKRNLIKNESKTIFRTSLYFIVFCLLSLFISFSK